MLEAELLWEECHVGQKDNNISPPPTTPSQSKTLFSTSNALDVLVVKDKENIKPTIIRGLGMMKSSLLSTQVRIEIVNTSCVVSGLFIVELPSLNETRQFIVDQHHDQIQRKLIFEQVFYKKSMSTFMQKNAEQDPKARNNSIVNVPSKGNSHLKKKLGQGL
jgi:hypothetical protein